MNNINVDVEKKNKALIVARLEKYKELKEKQEKNKKRG